jgi:UDP-3-O-[3-hydroxymyristoyl] N-acetylglucosamine deacetylase
MHYRSQRTLARPAEVAGIGFLTGADVKLKFRPAPADFGIAFQRTDRLLAPSIPALVEYCVPRQRRTAIERCGVVVEMIEHVMAALAGLQIDNCVVELNAPEPPGLDGSSLAFVEKLLDAGIVDQGVPRSGLTIANRVLCRSDDGGQTIAGAPAAGGGLNIRYTLDYGADSPIPAQSVSFDITPETFVNDIAFARTFILETEVEALRAQGYGRRTTARDLLIFGKKGVVDNQLRAADECARHKVLDCIGDLALAGCDIVGNVQAGRSGHRLNAEFVRRLQLIHAEQIWPSAVKNAA